MAGATRKKGQNFSPQELHVLVNEVECNKDALLTCFKDACSALAKKTNWADIAEKLNIGGGAGRNGEETRKKWSKYQSEVKAKAAAERRCANERGGGPPLDPKYKVTDEDSRVLTFIGSTTVHGVEGGLDTLDDAPPSNQPALNAVSTSTAASRPSSSSTTAFSSPPTPPPPCLAPGDSSGISERIVRHMYFSTGIGIYKGWRKKKGKRFIEEQRLEEAKEKLQLKKKQFPQNS
ncbi:uncharacterized protein LOC121406952 [Lytechinus variegatus]|uniref:uncharacterized protein LOC121406952 n=1 Tax=Lytechinus variegatus TaxID=7654 RepID=UPI001BB1D71B|nr:uncharacterized protein LOC121406952 [Lytechinus variegatus]